MHWLICGETGTGKTTKAIKMAIDFFKAKNKDSNGELRKIIIFDPFKDERWPVGPNVLLTDNREQFLKWFWLYFDALVIVDESAVVARKNDEDMVRTAILGRHQRHLIMYLCQRTKQINPTIRGQCSHLIVFGCSNEDAKTLADDKGCKELLEAVSLPDGTYLYVHRRGKPVKEKVF